MRVVLAFILLFINSICYAYDTYMSVETYRAYGKQQIKSVNEKGNTVLVTPHYASYKDRNANVTEKIVAIYDKRSPAYGYKYVLYKPIGKYVGHHRIDQPSPNGYGYTPVPAGDPTGRTDKTPCFPDILSAKKYYYPQFYGSNK